MKYLLDTHTAIWAFGEKAKLSATAMSILDDTSIHLCVSVVSAWEIAIKSSIGKANIVGGSTLFLEKMRKNGIEMLDLQGYHVKHIESMPFHHRDPFDRMLVSIAISEGMTILTADKNIQKYNVLWKW